jgi:hypothetical protein
VNDAATIRGKEHPQAVLELDAPIHGARKWFSDSTKIRKGR